MSNNIGVVGGVPTDIEKTNVKLDYKEAYNCATKLDSSVQRMQGLLDKLVTKIDEMKWEGAKSADFKNRVQSAKEELDNFYKNYVKVIPEQIDESVKNYENYEVN